MPCMPVDPERRCDKDEFASRMQSYDANRRTVDFAIKVALEREMRFKQLTQPAANARTDNTRGDYESNHGNDDSDDNPILEDCNNVSTQASNLISSLPDGTWQGWYEQQGRRSSSSSDLFFADGKVRGGGNDEVGEFNLRGTYVGTLATSMQMEWVKTYIGKHSVIYQTTQVERLPSGQVRARGKWQIP